MRLYTKRRDEKCLLLRKTLLLGFLLVTCSLFLSGQGNDWSEKEYSDYIQTLTGGEREVSVQSGRIDLVTDEFAFEIEWARKWKESIGQTLWYAMQTNKKPAIVLIMESKSDYKYYIQLNSALDYSGLADKVTVYLFPNDFEHLK